MLTRIEIDGFKSFYQFSLDIQPFQVIVGPNAAGKSNLFDAMRLLSRLTETDLRSAFQEARGESGDLFTKFPDGTQASEMKFAVELLLEPQIVDDWGNKSDIKNTRVRYELHLSRKSDHKGLEKLQIEHESLTPIPKAVDRWADSRRGRLWTKLIRYTKREKPYISCSTTNGLPTVTLFQEGRSGRARESVLAKLERTFLSGINSSEFPHGFAVREEVRKWKFLQLNPEALRLPYSRVSPNQIDASGQYFANMLARLSSQDPYILTDICSDLSNLVTGITRVMVEDDEARDQYMVKAQTVDGRTFSSRVLSDGTLRMLALASIKNDPGHRGVVLFEEPENGVHPLRIKRLVPLLREMASQFEYDEDDNLDIEEDFPLRQLIVNTHSPTLLSQLKDEEIVFAHVVDVILSEQNSPLRVTRMTSLTQGPDSKEYQYTLKEIISYLNSVDIESAISRLGR